MRTSAPPFNELRIVDNEKWKIEVLPVMMVLYRADLRSAFSLLIIYLSGLENSGIL
jgi:hypothetical protein